MHLKRYRRETVQEALRAVREDLGPDALVLSTRIVPASGVRGWWGARQVEITAATDRSPLSDDRHVTGRTDVARAQTLANRDARRAVDEITARLRATGLDDALAREVAEAHPPARRRGATLRSLRTTIAEQFASLAAADTAYAPIEVFVGPPGAGKTTTIAKIAAQERVRKGTRLALMSADGFRVGAVEQLRTYADVLGAPFRAARTPAELASALDSSRRPLLLDTPGRSPSDSGSRELFELLADRPDVRTHLVLPAGTSRDAARRLLDRFAHARPTRLVITKLDEAESIAPMVALLRDRELPISYVGTGQNVPEDLERATAPALAAWVTGDGVVRGVHA
jgi:flagellar biosynthesis protein FlhF